LEVENRIVEWLKEMKEKGATIEAISFYQELPIRVRTKVLDIDEARKFVQWESDPKLSLALSETGRVYFRFFDPLYKQNRIVGADATYYSDEFIETTYPAPLIAPGLNRQCLRVKTSEKLPVKAYLIGEDGSKKELKVRDVCEEGVGILNAGELLSLGEPVKIELVLPEHVLTLTGKVVSIDELPEGQKFGIKLNVRERDRKVLNNYVMARQREILNKIKEIAR